MTEFNIKALSGKKLRCRVIFNPISGRRAEEPFFDAFVRVLMGAGHEVEVCRTAAAHDATRLAAEGCNQGCNLICVRGGDGTIHEAANGMTPDGPPMLTIPAGTENILAKYLGIRRSARSLLDALAAGQSRQLRLSEVNGRKFLLLLGLPYDAEVIRLLAEARTGNISYKTYVWPTLKTLIGYRGPEIVLKIDGKEVYRGRGQVVVGKMPRYALGVNILRQADPADEWLDVAVFPRRSVLPLIVDCARMWLHAGWRSRQSLYLKGRDVQIEANAACPMQVDGEFGGMLPARVQTTNHVITLLAAPGRFEATPSIWEADCQANHTRSDTERPSVVRQ